jgi:4-amino-4-deoxy-L-arabinose transferase-like glycosyltransferase
MAEVELENDHLPTGKPRPGRYESANRPAPRARLVRKGALLWVFISSLAGLVLLLAPMSRSGIWDPVELRIADAAARVATSLFHARLGDATSNAHPGIPTLGELGRGELPYTSIAVGFRLFGLHDWAGRLPLALWISVALITMVVWVYRYVGQRAAIWAALVFPTLPIVFFQARFMLGDATTMASQFGCFACLSFACIDVPKSPERRYGTRFVWFGLALIAGALGLISRGVLIGVAVPFLAVGFVGISFDARTSKTRAWTQRANPHAFAALIFGLFALFLGIYAASRTGTVRGIWLIFQGANYQAGFHPHTFDSVVALLGHGLFPWSGFLYFALAATLVQIQSRALGGASARGLGALTCLVFLAAAAQTWLGGLGVTMPFPAVAGLAAIIGVGLDSVSRQKASLRLVSVGTVAVLVVLLADFESAPDKILAATASADAHIPSSFKNDSFMWIRGCCGAIFAVSALFGFGLGENTRGLLSRSEMIRFRDILRTFWRTHVGFYVLLVETALLTGAALLLATRLGVPLQRVRDLVSPQREVLAWSWLALPAIGVIVIISRWLLAALDCVFSPGFGLPEMASTNGRFARWAGGALARYPALRDVMPKRNAVWGACLVIVSAVFSLGWGAKLGEQLSPRRALSQFDSLSKPGEPLGLLGVRPQIIQYYSRQRPELLVDADEAADWLLYGQSTRRWLIVKGDQMPRLNAAYRERCKCQHNVPFVDARSSDMLLAVNRRVDGITDKNPFDDILPDHFPKPQQVLDADLGGQVEVLGWELVSSDGSAVAELRVGHRYELRLYFKVLARPTMDWETFVHIDGYGRRYNGDHDTTQGRYPTSNWRPGDVVVDSSTIVLDPSFLHGNYQLYFGLFKGTRRLEVRRGRQDENRLVAGTIRVH